MKVSKRLGIFACFGLILLTASLFFGCGKKTSDQQSGSANEEREVVEEAQTEEESDGTELSGRPVFMMGRSVMYGWFSHWNPDDASKPAKRGDFVLYYKELSTPPDIAESVKGYVDEIDADNTIVFFKFCFDDFAGSSRSEAKANLSDNKKYIQQVFKAVVEERGLKLIIGNALPRVENYTDSQLVWNHRTFNNWLEDFAAEHSAEVYVFDQYSVLSDSEGNLKSEYAADPEDSHPNDQAYSDLDDSFFSFLEENF